MKPPGIYMGLSADGNLTMGVATSNRAIDAIWNAVEEAIDAGIDPRKFKIEVRDAWEHHSKQRLKWDLEALEKSK